MRYEDLGITRQEGTTASGIRVVVYRIPRRPIALTVAINAGRRHDPRSLGGLSHTLEHMLMAGTEELPTKHELTGYIEQLGGTIGALTGLNLIMLNLTLGTAEDFPSAVHVLNQMLVHSRYDPETFTNEMSSVEQELAALCSNPRAYAERLAYEQLVAGSALVGMTMDNPTSLQRITLEAVRQHASQQLTGHNLVFVLAGGITLEAAIAALDRGLNLESTGQPLTPPAPIVRQANVPSLQVKSFANAPQAQLVYSFVAYPPGHPDNPALDILVQLLGKGGSSLLFQQLRYRAGLVYGVGADTLYRWGYDGLTISTATKPANVKRVMRLINVELERAASGELSPQDIAAAQEALIKSMPLQLDQLGMLVELHLGPDLYRWPDVTRVLGWLEAVKAVTPADIARVARAVFRPDSANLALCGTAPADLDMSILL
ncbi:MAG TPA: pitrilysin family protein [Candidatus Saccharimonadia bacterium]|nr:pitrilysin family protein [Candidatus Saccharimonadia bacterium]